MTAKEALLSSSLGIKVRLCVWVNGEYVTSLTSKIDPITEGTLFRGDDEKGNPCSFYLYNDQEYEWEIYHEPE